MPKTDKCFEWPSIYECSPTALVASRLFEPFLDERRARNREVWQDKRSWKFGFYFGKGDTRLWVPQRPKKGLYQDEVRVINFSHPLGRKAFRILVLAYATGAIAATMTIAAILGVRW